MFRLITKIVRYVYISVYTRIYTQITGGTEVLQRQPDLLTSLPPELLTTIFKYLDVTSRCKCLMTCRKFAKVISGYANFYKKIEIRYPEMDGSMLKIYLSNIPVPPEAVTMVMDFTVSITSHQMFHTHRFFLEHGNTLHQLHIENLNDFRHTLTGDFGELFKNCSRVERLTLSWSLLLSNPESNPFESITTLKTLKVVDCSENSSGFVADIMTNNHNLRAFFCYETRGCVFLELTLRHYTDANFRIIEPNLEEIYFQVGSSIEVTEVNFLRLFGRLRKLKKIVLIGKVKRDVRGVSRVEFDFLLGRAFWSIAQGCPRLRSLTIRGWEIVHDDILLPILQNCNRLTHLDLQGPSVTTRIYDVISRGPLKYTLKSINIRFVADTL